LRTVTIGIPSYNEGTKIISLIRSLYQDSRLYKSQISEIIVCDHSSDSTPEILSTFISQNPSLKIRLIHEDERRGAACAWNAIFSEASGDVIVLFDADVSPDDSCLSELASGINEEIGLCASNPICFSLKSISARATSFISNWLGAIRKKRISQYTVMGRSLSIRSDLARAIAIPKETIAIDLYLQCKVIELGHGIVYREKARVYFRPPTTLQDFASQVLRSKNGHKQIDSEIKRLEINASLWSIIVAAVQTARAYPLNALCTLFCFCLLPYYRTRLHGINSYKWAIATSTKDSEELNYEQ
jgi:glycosyltransferase involved in cell wall biosynthesis